MILPIVLATCIFLHVGITDDVTRNNTLSRRIVGSGYISEGMFNKYPFTVFLIHYPKELIPYTWNTVKGMYLQIPVDTADYYRLDRIGDEFYGDLRRYPRCTGSIIEQRWILTAARCVQLESGMVIALTNMDTMTAEHVMDFDQVPDVFHHPDFDGHNNDIALLRLKKRMLMGRPIKVANTSVSINTKCTLVGVGTHDITSTNLEPGELDVFTTRCDDSYGLLDRKDLKESILCTSTKNGHGACMGDEGGPLFIEYVPGMGIYTLIGFLSRFVTCAVGVPDTFTNVSYYHEWIVETMTKYNF